MNFQELWQKGIATVERVTGVKFKEGMSDAEILSAMEKLPTAEELANNATEMEGLRGEIKEINEKIDKLPTSLTKEEIQAIVKSAVDASAADTQKANETFIKQVKDEVGQMKSIVHTEKATPAAEGTKVEMQMESSKVDEPKEKVKEEVAFNFGPGLGGKAIVEKK